MIKSYQFSEKITPKEKAAEIVDDFLYQMLEGWREAFVSQSNDMSVDERLKVKAQLEAYTKRIQKMLGRN